MNGISTGALPDYAVPTGDYIAEWMEDNGINAAELARRMGVSRKHVSELLRGQAPLSREMALRLERVTGVPANNWNNLEALYQEDQVRLAAQADLAAGYDAVAKFPLNYLRKWGFVTAPKTDRPGTVSQVLAFFRVGGIEALTASWAGSAIAYRKTAASLPSREDLMTWLMVAEHLVSVDNLPPFDRDGFESMVPKLRELTLGNPDTYVDEAVELLASAGVALCLVPEVPKLKVYGATRWVQGHPLIQLSLRGKTDDQLWFTLFHEVGHVLKHPPTKLYMVGTSQKEEMEADRFAADTLIPPEQATSMPRERNLQAVRDFAEAVGVAPGIVIGRIQRETEDYAWGNALKQRFEFCMPARQQ